ncbi:OmpA family protein [Desulfopila inferna]|uniref:OmpA family protein n=1 Tax=Desulfopila inferna TaxID=468528 RepID=UPI001963F95D|nr:OmpA family protein [Desulfopila inferna]MBM9603455.1 OmpA family protein [Desulfopila inferna]
MKKKIIFLTAIVLCICSPALAIDFPGGGLNFSKSSTAYSSQYFDKILQAYGLQLESHAGIPATYATVVDGKAAFNATSTAYTPVQYHSILTAYGLELTPESVQQRLQGSSYAAVAGDRIVFGDTPTAYGSEWENIIGAYSLAAQPEPEPEPVVTQQPAVPGDDDGDGVPNHQDACPGTPEYAAVDERGCWVLASAGLLFDFDKAVIKPEYYSLLESTKMVFDNNPEMRVQVEGHTDSVGSAEYNQNLSQERAQAVVDYLSENAGVERERLQAVGYGESRPAYSNETKEGQAKNRRVEFTPIQ